MYPKKNIIFAPAKIITITGSMKIFTRVVVFLYLISFSFEGYSQDYIVDSLFNEYQSIEMPKHLSLEKYMNKEVFSAPKVDEMAHALWQNRYSNPDTVSMICKKALEFHPENKDILLCLYASQLILGEFLEAVKYHGRLYQLRNSFSKQKQAYLYRYTGNFFGHIGNYDRAFGLLDQSIELFKHLQLPGEQAISVTSKIDILMQSGQYAPGLKNRARENLKLARQSKNLHAMAWTHHTYGMICKQSGQIKKALHYFFLAAIYDKKAGINDCAALHSIAKAYKKLKRYGKAERFALLSLRISEKYNVGFQAKYAHEILYSIYRDKNNHDQALYHLEKSKLLTRKIFNKELAMSEFERLKGQNELNEQRLRANINLIIFVFAFFALILFLVLYILYQNARNKKVEIRNNKLVIENLNSKIHSYEKSKEITDLKVKEYENKISQMLVPGENGPAADLTENLDNVNTELNKLRNESRQASLQIEINEAIRDVRNQFYAIGDEKKSAVQKQTGKKALHQKIDDLARLLVHADNHNQLLHQITDREKQLLACLKCNLKPDEISAIMFISKKSVFDYSSRIRRKLQLTQAEFTSYLAG